MDAQKFPIPAAPAVSFWEVVREKVLVILGLSVFCVGILFVLDYLRPAEENKVIAGVVLTTFAALLAYLKSEQSHRIMNSRMTEWMQNSEKVAESRGYALAVTELELKKLQELERTALAAKQLVDDAAAARADIIRVADEKARFEHAEQALVTIEAEKALLVAKRESEEAAARKPQAVPPIAPASAAPPLVMQGLTLTGTVKGTVEGDVKEKDSADKADERTEKKD